MRRLRSDFRKNRIYKVFREVGTRLQGESRRANRPAGRARGTMPPPAIEAGKPGATYA